MATFHENLKTSFNRFRDKYLKANGNYFFFSYDSTSQKYGYTIGSTFYPFKVVQASKSVTAGTSNKTLTPDSGYDGVASVTVSPTPSETKTATPSTSSQNITPSSGKLLSKVTVSAIPTETKTITAGTSASTTSATSGKYITSVTVNPTPSQEKTVTASRSAQTVTPDSGKLLSKVTVNKYPDASDTYGTITTNGTHDMGATNDYRYVGVNVPATLKDSKTFVSGFTFNDCKVGDVFVCAGMYSKNQSSTITVTGAVTIFSQTNITVCIANSTSVSITFSAYGHICRLRIGTDV